MRRGRQVACRRCRERRRSRRRERRGRARRGCCCPSPPVVSAEAALQVGGHGFDSRTLHRQHVVGTRGRAPPDGTNRRLDASSRAVHRFGTCRLTGTIVGQSQQLGETHAAAESQNFGVHGTNLGAARPDRSGASRLVPHATFPARSRAPLELGRRPLRGPAPCHPRSRPRRRPPPSARRPPCARRQPTRRQPGDLAVDHMGSVPWCPSDDPPRSTHVPRAPLHLLQPHTLPMRKRWLVLLGLFFGSRGCCRRRCRDWQGRSARVRSSGRRRWSS